MSASYDNDAIKGEQLEVLATEIAKRLLSDGSVVAEALNSLAIRLESVEHGLSEIGNAGLGERGLVSLMTSNASDSENFAATPKSVKTAYDSLNGSKQNKLSTAQQSAVDSGITSSKRSSYDTHIADAGIHVTNAQKEVWDGKADDAAVVHLSGTETVTGVKTFSNSTTDIVNPQATDITRFRVFKPGETNWNGGVRLQLEYDPDGGRGLWDSNISENDGNVLWIDTYGQVRLHGMADYASSYAEFGERDAGVALRDALPRFFSKEFNRVYLSALQENNVANLFNLSVQQAGFLFWTVQLEDVPVDMVITFTVIKSNRAWGDGEEHSSVALYVKSGNSTVSFITQYSYNVDDSGNRWYYLTALPRHSYSDSISCRATCFRLTGAVQRFGGAW